LDGAALVNYMTTFEDGPAKGVVLMLHRSPRFLRITVRPMPGTGKPFPWDALDQLDDTPTPDETLHVYERTDTGAVIHRRGTYGCLPVASYRYVADQPADADMRTTEAWRRWCQNRIKHELGQTGSETP